MATTLALEEMKARVRAHFRQFVDDALPEVIERNMTPNFVDHDGPGGKPTDVLGDEQMMRAMLGRLPGITVEVLDLVAEGDRVFCRNVWHWQDPVTGVTTGFQGFVGWRFEGDRIAERWATVTTPATSLSWMSL